MSTSTEPIARAAETVREAAHDEAQRYAHGEQRPLGGYVVLIAVYTTMVGLLGALVRRRGGPPDRMAAADVALLGVATHKLSRLITKDSVTAVVRAPFATFSEPSGEGEVHEEVHGDGLRHAAGELLTCPFCAGVWVATALAFGLVLAPRATRFLAVVLTAVTGSDFLQLAYAIAQRSAEGS